MPDSYTELANGNGLNVVVLSNGREGGIKLVGDDITTERPVYIGGFASGSIANPAPLTEGLLAPFKITLDGRVINMPYCNPEDIIDVAPVVLANDTSSHELIPSQGATTKIAFLGGILSCAVLTTFAHMVISSAPLGDVLRIPLVNGPFLLPLPIRTNVNGPITYTMSATIGANNGWFRPVAYKTKL